jgi:hypothetical protein
MDPYLEDDALWPSFHHQLVLCLQETLASGLADRHRAALAERRYPGSGPLPGEYDVAVGQRRYSVTGTGGVEHRQEDCLEVRRKDGGKPVTLVDVVSPANKTTDAGRRAYLATRRERRQAGASVVEIDLVLQGRPTLDYPRDGLPPFDYAVTVIRATQPERYELYTSTLQTRLPRFRLPLAPGDRDLVVDLLGVFARCYDRGGFAARVDYGREPPAPLDEARRHWLDKTLTARGLRKAAPPLEEVAVAAYYIWEQEGRPHGQDREHWRTALAQLRRG